MSAETLRRAAALMRERAEAASAGPWSVGTYGLDVLSEGLNIFHGCCDNDGYVDGGNAEHIASWHPAVALAVADWLDNAAHLWPFDGLPALAVANAYLGEPS